MTPWTNTTLLSGDPGAPVPDRPVTWRPLQTASLVLLLVNELSLCVLAALLRRYQKRQLLKAASPLMLGFVMVGLALTTSQLAVLAYPGPLGRPSGVLLTWLRLTGFVLTFGALALKTWRIKIILRFYKCQMMNIKDSAIILRLGALFCVTLVFLLTFTLACFFGPDSCQSQTIRWWEVISWLGEASLLLWALSVCYRTRHAPSMYNDAHAISLIMSNECAWLAAAILFRFLVFSPRDDVTPKVFLLVKTQFSFVYVVALTFIYKYRALWNRSNVIEGVISEVYGSARIHRLTLVLNHRSKIQTVNCVPCGPLHDAPDDSLEQETEVRETRETQYSKEEVDALIELVSKLKAEKTNYKLKYGQLFEAVQKHAMLFEGGHRGLVKPSPLTPNGLMGPSPHSHPVQQNGVWIGNYFASERLSCSPTRPSVGLSPYTPCSSLGPTGWSRMPRSVTTDTLETTATPLAPAGSFSPPYTPPADTNASPTGTLYTQDTFAQLRNRHSSSPGQSKTPTTPGTQATINGAIFGGSNQLPNNHVIVDSQSPLTSNSSLDTDVRETTSFIENKGETNSSPLQRRPSSLRLSKTDKNVFRGGSSLQKTSQKTHVFHI